MDFGTSFWTSNIIKSEFPGLLASGFKSIGKFGIGFYSIFMIADSVIVASRNWKEGLSEIHQLIFKNGFTLRPILKKGSLNNFHSSISTQIRIKLKKSIISDDLMVEIKTNRMGSQNFKAPLSDYLSAICAGLDVSVFYKGPKGIEYKIHTDVNDLNFDKSKWLNTISFSNYRIPKENSDYIAKNLDRLKPIKDENGHYGLAAISTTLTNEQDFLSISTVGGLANSVHQRDSRNFIGYIDFNAKSAKREIGDFAANDSLINEWATSQLSDLLKINLNPFECYAAAASLCHFKVDPSELAQILISVNKEQHFYTFNQLADLSVKCGIAFLESNFGGHIETFHNIVDLPNYALIRTLTGGSFLNLNFDENDKPVENNSILDCLYRTIKNRGYEISVNRIENIGYNTFNQSIRAIIILARRKK